MNTPQRRALPERIGWYFLLPAKHQSHATTTVFDMRTWCVVARFHGDSVADTRAQAADHVWQMAGSGPTS